MSAPNRYALLLAAHERLEVRKAEADAVSGALVALSRFEWAVRILCRSSWPPYVEEPWRAVWVGLSGEGRGPS